MSSHLPISSDASGRRVVGAIFTPIVFSLANTQALPGYVAPGYAKLGNGLVMLRGTAYCTDAVAPAAVLATLPAGFRPGALVIGPYDPTGGGRTDVNAAGQIITAAGAGAGAYFVTFHHLFVAEG